MENIAARQGITGTLLVLDVILTAFLGWYLISSIRTESWKVIYARLENQAAIGLFALLVGHGIIRGWSLFLLLRQSRGLSSWELENAYPIAFVGAAIAVLGKVCIIRVFSLHSWGNWGWVFALLVTAVFVVVILRV